MENNGKELENTLLEHCYNMGILKQNAFQKKKEAILDNLIASIVRIDMTLKEVKECIEDVKNDKVVNLDFFKKGGNLFKDYINPKWKEFAKALFRQRSVGLGTPNSASGEGELMFLFLSKKIKKPTKGDLQIGSKIMELKGEQVRVQGRVRGKDFREKTLKICEEFGLTPNKSKVKKKEINAVELEKVQHLEHWKKELSKLSISKQKEFISKWLSCLDNKKHEDSVNRIFKNNSFKQKSLIKEIVKILYAVMVENGNFDEFIILGNGENAKILSKDKEDFNKKVDEGIIEITKWDYFRINQDFNIGWYIA